MANAKETWLTPGFFSIRLLGGFGLITLMNLIYIRASLTPDLVQAKARLGSDAPSWWDSVTGGASNLDQAREAGLKRQSQVLTK